MSTITDSTRFIEVSTGRYPVTFDEIKAQFVTTHSFGNLCAISDLQSIGFEPVVVSAMPVADVVEEGLPSLSGGVYTRTWVTRAFNADEVAAALLTSKQRLCEQIDGVRDNDISYGLVFSFADGTVGGVQMRPEDRTNLIGIRLEAEAYSAANIVDPVIEFRSLENVTRLLTAGEIIALTNAATQHTKKIYGASWALKDQVRTVASVANLPSVPSTFV